MRKSINDRAYDTTTTTLVHETDNGLPPITDISRLADWRATNGTMGSACTRY